MAQNLKDGVLIACSCSHDGLICLREVCIWCSLTINHARHLHADRTQTEVFANGIPVVFVQALGKINLTYHSRQHMTVLKMEVVVRTIQVGRHHCYVVGTILQIERFAHLQSGNLCDSIRFVGVFER